MRYKNLGNICYVTLFWGGPCSAQNQVGGPGQSPGLPMLMTTTAWGSGGKAFNRWAIFCNFFVKTSFFNRNYCNYILFTKWPWPGDGEGTFRFSSQAATCLPHMAEASHCPF